MSNVINKEPCPEYDKSILDKYKDKKYQTDEVWICNDCGKYVTEGILVCPACGYINYNTEGAENFFNYYRNWFNETKFLSTGLFENEWFKKICNPVITPIWEVLRGINEVLKFGDDHIAYALEVAYVNFSGQQLFDCEGYVSLEDYCNACRSALVILLEYDDEDKILDGIEEF